jgi:uncharacterized damage-inducible protein DinB
MDPKVTPISNILRLNTDLYRVATKDLKPGDAAVRPQETANAMLWLAGHVASNRFFMGNLLGLPDQSPWGDTFGGTMRDPSSLPPLAEVMHTFEEVTPILLSRLEQSTAEQLAGPLPQPFPGYDQTVLGGLTFLSGHECYHIGQIGYARRLFGYESIFNRLFAGTA